MLRARTHTFLFLTRALTHQNRSITNNVDKDRGQTQGITSFDGQDNNSNRARRDGAATEQIPVSLENNIQSDPRYGRHESITLYVKCFQRERNMGLWTADRNVNNRGATSTRQNNKWR